MATWEDMLDPNNIRKIFKVLQKDPKILAVTIGKSSDVYKVLFEDVGVVTIYADEKMLVKTLSDPRAIINPLLMTLQGYFSGLLDDIDRVIEDIITGKDLDIYKSFVVTVYEFAGRMSEFEVDVEYIKALIKKFHMNKSN